MHYRINRQALYTQRHMHVAAFITAGHLDGLRAYNKLATCSK